MGFNWGQALGGAAVTGAGLLAQQFIKRDDEERAEAREQRRSVAEEIRWEKRQQIEDAKVRARADSEMRTPEGGKLTVSEANERKVAGQPMLSAEEYKQGQAFSTTHTGMQGEQIQNKELPARIARTKELAEGVAADTAYGEQYRDPEFLRKMAVDAKNPTQRAELLKMADDAEEIKGEVTKANDKREGLLGTVGVRNIAEEKSAERKAMEDAKQEYIVARKLMEAAEADKKEDRRDAREERREDRRDARAERKEAKEAGRVTAANKKVDIATVSKYNEAKRADTLEAVLPALNEQRAAAGLSPLPDPTADRAKETAARKEAQKEANARKSWIKNRQAEFPETGGDEKAYVDLLTKKKLGLVGTVAAPGGGTKGKATVGKGGRIVSGI